MLEVILRFVDNDGIVYHNCLNVLFINLYFKLSSEFTHYASRKHDIIVCAYLEWLKS